ncbi:MAG: hypothetical protein AB1898_10895 [Acidobacteriota bacterium]
MGPTLQARTNQEGMARFKLSSAGSWYVKFIHMMPSEEPNVDYESKWASRLKSDSCRSIDDPFGLQVDLGTSAKDLRL